MRTKIKAEKAINHAPPPTTKTRSAAQAVATVFASRIAILSLADVLFRGAGVTVRPTVHERDGLAQR